jgi:glycerophosphoryl diester phosphodiesterase
MTLDGINGNFNINTSNCYFLPLEPEESTEIFDVSDNNVPENIMNIPLIAHRGYSDIAPENTLPAFYAAAENGFTTAECDIEWTKDNVPVLLHDKTINRTARRNDGIPMVFKHSCSDYTFEELTKNFDFGIWKGQEFKNTKIPSFEELLQCSKETGLNLYVEIKTTDNFNEEKAEILADMVKEAGLEDKITWISFDSNYLKTLSELMPESRLGYLYNGNVTEDTIKTLESLKTGSNEVFIDIKYLKMNEQADELLDEAGFPFEAWTVDDIDDMEDVSGYECSGITTNSITEKELKEYFNTDVE